MDHEKRNYESMSLEELAAELPLEFRHFTGTPSGLWRLDCCLPGIPNPLVSLHDESLRRLVMKGLIFAERLDAQSEEVAAQLEQELKTAAEDGHDVDLLTYGLLAIGNGV